MNAEITAVVTPKGVMKKVFEGGDNVEEEGEEEAGEAYDNDGRELQFDDGWDKAQEEEGEVPQERQLEIDDDWGDNMDEEIPQQFGQYGDDEDVKQKHIKEEEEKEEEERKKLEEEERAKEREKEIEVVETRELVFDDF
jgi:hypothetical protein